MSIKIKKTVNLQDITHWAIFWAGDTITLPVKEGEIFITELEEAGEEYAYRPLIDLSSEPSSN